jgi:hypothetical protein
MTLPTDYSISDRCHLEALTSIHHTYTLAATDEAETSEVDKVIVKHFEEIIAEISLAIASRKENNRE